MLKLICNRASLLVVIAIAIHLSQPALALQDKATVYKIPEAGMQLTLPAGWESEKDKSGTITISKKENDSYVVIAFTLLPTDPSMTFDKEFALFSEGIFDLIKKDWKTYKAEDVHKDTANGMALILQPFTGSAPDAGGDVEGLIVVVGAPKPVGVFAQRTKKHSDSLGKECADLLGSMKKIE